MFGPLGFKTISLLIIQYRCKDQSFIIEENSLEKTKQKTLKATNILIPHFDTVLNS